MNGASTALVVYIGLPVAAVLAWWARHMWYRVRGRAAPSRAGARVMAYVALLGPAAAALGLHLLAARGVEGPWQGLPDRPEAVLLWAAAYAFVVAHVLAALTWEADVSQELRASERRMELYRRMADIMDTPQKPRAALYLMLDQLMNEFAMQVGMVHLANERGELSLATYRNVDAPTASVLGTVPPGEGLLGQVQGTAAPAQVVGGPGVRLSDREVHLGADVQHVVVVPLRASGTTLGVLTLARREAERLSRDEMESLSLVASQVGAFVESRGLAHRSSEGAGVRGFLDPQAFVRTIEMEMARARRYGRPLTVASVRVSGWVQEGDMEFTGRALRAVSDVIRRNLWVADYCTSHGNGRFSLLLPDTGQDGALAVARRLAYRIATTEDLEGVEVRLEMAAVSYPEHGDTVDELLQALQYLPLQPVTADGDAMGDDETAVELWQPAPDPAARAGSPAPAWDGAPVTGEPEAAPAGTADPADAGSPWLEAMRAQAAPGEDAAAAEPAWTAGAPDPWGTEPPDGAAAPAEEPPLTVPSADAVPEPEAVAPEPFPWPAPADGVPGEPEPGPVTAWSETVEPEPAAWPAARQEPDDAWWRALLSADTPREADPAFEPAAPPAGERPEEAPPWHGLLEFEDAPATEPAPVAEDEYAGWGRNGAGPAAVEEPPAFEEPDGPPPGEGLGAWGDTLRDTWSLPDGGHQAPQAGPVPVDTATADRPAPAEDGAPAWSAASGLEAYEGYLPTEESPAPEEAAGEEVAASGARPEEVRLEADGPAEQAPAAAPWGGDEEQAWEEAAAREGPLTWLQR
ncbi:MAG TPA: GAF domain-containing protein, partial [Dehalococcoidia bacterium]